MTSFTHKLPKIKTTVELIYDNQNFMVNVIAPTDEIVDELTEQLTDWFYESFHDGEEFVDVDSDFLLRSAIDEIASIFE